MRTYPATIAARLRTALHDGDTAALAALLHPDVRFEPLDPATPTAHGSAEALAWYRERRDRGVRTLVEEQFAYPGSVVLGLRLSHPQPSSGAPAVLYRVFRLQDDRVVHIRDFADRTHALTTAAAPCPWTA
ncbi:nuclear transport factor 2 family protein [Streptacidiphilus melanogenes]|uniref:nuclear transport factor 2 family protein n=1 Tax=Streptacidiphilus melanogenes TaxID=411235 RepID=UPI0005A7C020|nr:nuclear transport factor 2 family protein [Streptacidiphilus melanogenes]